MGVRSFQINLTGTNPTVPKRLSDVYGNGPNVVNPAEDVEYVQLLMHSSGAPACHALLSDSPAQLEAGEYGYRLPNPDVSLVGAPPVFSIGPLRSDGGVRLSDLYAIGQGDVGTGSVVLHILGITA